MIEWERIANMENVNDCVIFYSEKVAEVIDQMAPLKKKKMKKNLGSDCHQ